MEAKKIIYVNLGEIRIVEGINIVDMITQVAYVSQAECLCEYGCVRSVSRIGNRGDE